MHFESGHLYHIYNQGNNRQQVFFARENYLFFLRKVKGCFAPYADMLAWCLMPNHFHFMVRVNELTVGVVPCGQRASHGVTQSHAVTDSGKSQSLNDSIGILLRSYTRAINKQENRSGKLFRETTKAECLTQSEGVTPSFLATHSGTLSNTPPPEKQYPQLCFDYIHQNPVKAGLVEKATDWEFSSAREYAGLRHGTLVDRRVAGEYVDYSG